MRASSCRPVIALTACLAAMTFAGTAQEPSFEVLYEFERPGAQPLAPLLLHSNGNFYGTTVEGGACGQGTIFRLAPSGELATIASFSGDAGPTPGSAPLGSLAEGPGGELFGTTSSGGAGGFGVAFKLTASGAYTVLSDFTGQAGPAKGSVPGGLVGHPDGNFYGTTAAGGTNGFGTVFRLTPAGNITTLLEFSGTGGARPGSQPVGPLAIRGSMLYGVTQEGGSSNEGTAYELTTGGGFRTLVSFDASNGSLPNPLAAHSNGVLYGTAEFGGDFDFGTAFSLSTGPAPVLGVLHHFDDVSGSQPTGHLTEVANGSLVGVTSLGGTDGLGAIFTLATDGTYTVLGNLTGESGALPGAEPLAGLTAGSNGRLFGLSSAGGPANLGTAFRIDPAPVVHALANFSLPTGWFPSGAPRPDLAGGYYFPVAAGGDEGGGAILYLAPGAPATVAAPLGGPLGDAPEGGLLKVGSDYFGITTTGGERGRGTAYAFHPSSGVSLTATYRNANGSHAEGPLVVGSDGALYGVAREGGTLGQGTVYRLTSTGERTRLVSFTGLGGSAPGAGPRGPLALASNGDLYGLAQGGGAANAGLIFKVSLSGDYTVVHEFLSTEPRTPRGGLATGADGFLYGTTSLGGAAGAGTVIRIDPSDDSWSVLGTFTDTSGPALGRAPSGPLAIGPGGALYGMTCAGGPDGKGGVFRIAPGGPLEALVMFTGEGGTAPGRGEAIDGPFRYRGGLTIDPDGVVHGLAPAGGAKGGGVAFLLRLSQPFAIWKQTHLGDSEAPDLGDPDRDGLPTLFEYALLLLPQLSDADQQPHSEIRAYPEGRRLAILMPRDPAHSDITIRVEASSTLQDPWALLAISTSGQPFDGPGVVGGDSALPGIKTVEIRDIVEFVGNPGRFFRIRVTRN